MLARGDLVVKLQEFADAERRDPSNDLAHGSEPTIRWAIQAITEGTTLGLAGQEGLMHSASSGIHDAYRVLPGAPAARK